MKNEILSKAEVEDAIKKADTWRDITSEKRRLRIEKNIAESAKFINW
jgi:hypothetical protein